MKKFSIIFLTAVAVSAISQSVCAADSKKSTIVGVGAIECGIWIKGRSAHDEKIDNLFLAWLQGYLSGLNGQRILDSRNDTASVPGPDSVLAYIDKYCREHPLETVVAGATMLYGEIAPIKSH